ncbi:hypothetical protein GCM10009646_57270 [Streptomyces aureus]
MFGVADHHHRAGGLGRHGNDEGAGAEEFLGTAQVTRTEHKYAGPMRQPAQNRSRRTFQEITGHPKFRVTLPSPVQTFFQHPFSGLPQGDLVQRAASTVVVSLQRNHNDQVESQPSPVCVIGSPGKGQMPIPDWVEADDEFTAFAGPFHDFLLSS